MNFCGVRVKSFSAIVWPSNRARGRIITEKDRPSALRTAKSGVSGSPVERRQVKEEKHGFKVRKTSTVVEQNLEKSGAASFALQVAATTSIWVSNRVVPRVAVGLGQGGLGRLRFLIPFSFRNGSHSSETRSRLRWYRR